MLKRVKSNHGQNTVEYMLLMAVVIGVILVAVQNNGFLTLKINKSLDLAVSGIECMVSNISYGNEVVGALCP